MHAQNRKTKLNATKQMVTLATTKTSTIVPCITCARAIDDITCLVRRIWSGTLQPMLVIGNPMLWNVTATFPNQTTLNHKNLYQILDYCHSDTFD